MAKKEAKGVRSVSISSLGLSPGEVLGKTQQRVRAILALKVGEAYNAGNINRGSLAYALITLGEVLPSRVYQVVKRSGDVYVARVK